MAKQKTYLAALWLPVHYLLTRNNSLASGETGTLSFAP